MIKMKDLLSKEEKNKLGSTTIPTHVAIIMDGNRRWAKEKNILTIFGHKKGVETLKTLSRYADDIGIKYLTVYAFSTENWNRTKSEVEFLLHLIKEVIENEIEEMHKENVRLKIIGLYEDLPKPLPEILDNAMEKTKNNSGLKLQVAINYGSRAEITRAVKEIAKKVKSNELKIEGINEKTINENLFTSDIPDPDLLIRTGGEQRISNYLLWQSAYAELYYTQALWPDFTPEELDKAISEFNKRQRRYGT